MKSSIALCRLDKPIGIYLIFWPALAAAVISTDVISNLDVLAFIMIGSILVRSIGCVINDIFDKDIDSHMHLSLIDPNKSSNHYCQFHFWMHDYPISLDEAFFSGSSIILRDYL